MPPSLAKAMPICSPDTACITAETMGTFMVRGHSSPFLNRGFQGNIRGDAVLRGIAGHQQILAEGVRGFLKEIRHIKITSFREID